MVQPVDCSHVSQSLSEAVTIVTIVVPAAVAIAATFLAHVFTARREGARASVEADRARKALLRDKLENVVALVGEHYDARQKYASEIVALGIYSSRGQAAPDVMSDRNTASDRAEAIATLYFPGLSEEMKAVRAATAVITQFALSELATMRADTKGYADGPAATVSGRLAQAISGLRDARNALARKARTMIDKELAP